MQAYATAEQLGSWLDPTSSTPADVADAYAARFGDSTPERVLLRATEVVEGAVLSGYTVDANGAPLDDDVAAWLADACCAQVEYWGLVSEQHDVAGVTTGTMSAGGVTHDMPQTVAPRALRVLDLAGLRTPWGGWNRYRRPLELIGRSYS